MGLGGRRNRHTLLPVHTKSGKSGVSLQLASVLESEVGSVEQRAELRR